MSLNKETEVEFVVSEEAKHFTKKLISTTFFSIILLNHIAKLFIVHVLTN